MTFNWDEQTAVVIGGGGAMGTAVVDRLIEKGANVVAADRAEGLDALGRDESGSLRLVPVDAADRSSVASVFDACDQAFGPVSLLVNLAGINSLQRSVLECDEEEWSRVLAVNVGGTFWACQQALARMMPLQRGSIVNTSSIYGLRGRRGAHSHPYSASKAAVAGLTRTLAAEAGEHGIRVNAVAPGLHLSRMSLTMFDTEEETKAWMDAAIDATPLRRLAQAPEVADLFLFLLDDGQSGYITAQTIVSDGGRISWYE